MNFYEVHQLLALKESGPHGVALAKGHSEGHGAAEGLVAVFHQAGVGGKGNEGVDIAVNSKERDAGPGQRGQAVDRVIFCEPGTELVGIELVGPSCLIDAGVAGQITDWVDAGKGRNVSWIFSGP